MIQLSEVLENEMIYESFKSSVLRDFIRDMKEMRSIFKSPEKLDQLLPRGIAWDKIEDDEVFEGESRDQAFIKKFVTNTNSSKYMVIWYSLLPEETFKQNNDKVRHRVNRGDVFLTVGSKFVGYDVSSDNWRVADQAMSYALPKKNDETAASHKSYLDNREKRKSYNKALDVDKLRSGERLYRPSVQEYTGPKGGHLTVKLLAENTTCSCIAISLDTIAKYSTLELMKDRFNSKEGAVALLQKKVSDVDRFKNLNREQTYAYKYGSDLMKLVDAAGLKGKSIVDYPDIIAANRIRYKNSTSSYSIGAFSKMVEKDIKPIATAIKLWETCRIKDEDADNYDALTADGLRDFVDAYFNNHYSGSMDRKMNDKHLIMQQIHSELTNIHSKFMTIVIWVDSVFRKYEDWRKTVTKDNANGDEDLRAAYIDDFNSYSKGRSNAHYYIRTAKGALNDLYKLYSDRVKFVK